MIPIGKNTDGIRQVVHGFWTGKDPVGIYLGVDVVGCLL